MNKIQILKEDKTLTVKDLRTTTAPYNEIAVVYGENEITLKAEDKTTLEAFGSFLIDNISIKDEETITATLIMRPVKED